MEKKELWFELFFVTKQAWLRPAKTSEFVKIQIIKYKNNKNINFFSKMLLWEDGSQRKSFYWKTIKNLFELIEIFQFKYVEFALICFVPWYTTKCMLQILEIRQSEKIEEERERDINAAGISLD